jgi:hypothetical protein
LAVPHMVALPRLAKFGELFCKPQEVPSNKPLRKALQQPHG